MFRECRAKARSNGYRPCRQPAMANGKCRLHGGLCTGPKTPEGIQRIKNARTTHGYYTAEAIAERKEMRAFMKEAKASLR